MRRAKEGLIQGDFPWGFSLYGTSAPILIKALTNAQAWLDKAHHQGEHETAILEARLAPDMRPFPAQISMASDTAKNAIARLVGRDAPAMPDTEASFAELKDRCQRTIAFIESVDRTALQAADERYVELEVPNGMGYRFNGGEHLAGFALPNFSST